MLSEHGAAHAVVTGSTPASSGWDDGLATSPVAAGARRRPVMTTEGVVLDLHPAGLASRLCSGLIDLFLMYVAVSAASWMLTVVVGVTGSDTIAAIGVAVIAGVSLIGYPVAIETLWHGRTVGKAALGLRAVTTEGGPIGFRAAAIRGALLLVDVVAVPVGVLWTVAMLGSTRRRRLGDIAAGTVVVRERRGDLGSLQPTLFIPPPQLFAYRDRLDVGRLDAAGYRVIRSVLLRQRQLEPPAGAGLVDRCAHSVAARLGHRISGGISAEHYLACVASAYQLRYRR